MDGYLGMETGNQSLADSRQIVKKRAPVDRSFFDPSIDKVV